MYAIIYLPDSSITNEHNNKIDTKAQEKQNEMKIKEMLSVIKEKNKNKTRRLDNTDKYIFMHILIFSYYFALFLFSIFHEQMTMID